MFSRIFSQFRSSEGQDSFNMTPIIDIVFLLIIFFLVVCQFIEAENYPVDVPDNCDFAERADENNAGAATITIMKTDSDNITYAVGSEKIESADIVSQISELVNLRLDNLPEEKKNCHFTYR